MTKHDRLASYLLKTFNIKPTLPQVLDIERIVIGEPKRKRSNAQNRAIHVLPLQMLSDAMSESWGELVTIDRVKDEIKERYAHIFLEHAAVPYDYKPITNKEGKTEYIQPRLSFANLTTIGDSLLFQEMQKFGAEWFNISIPSPNEQDFTQVTPPRENA